MGSASTVTRNAAWLMLQRVFLGVFSVFVVAVVARYLGTERYGHLVLFLSYSALFVQFSNLGLRPYSVRAMAADRSRAALVVEEMLALRGSIAVAVAIVAAAYLFWVDPFLPDALVAVLALQLVMNAVSMCYLDGLYGMEAIKEVAKSLAASGVAVQLGSLLAVALDAGTVGVACTYVLGSVVTLGVARRFLVARTGPVRPRMPTAALLHHVKGSRSFFFQNIVHTVRQRLDIILITSFLGTHAAGVYGASLTLVQRLDIIQDALTTALFPRVSSLQGQATDELRELVRLSFKLMLVFSMPLAIGIFGIAEDIVHLVFGTQFEDATPVLALIALALPFGFVYGLLFNVLSALGRQDEVFRWALAVFVPDLAFTVAGILLGGVPGAAAALVLVVISLVMPLAFVYTRSIGSLARGGDMARIAAASAAMAGCLWLLADAHLVLRVGACIAVYAIAVLAFRVVTPATIRTILKRRQPRAGDEHG